MINPVAFRIFGLDVRWYGIIITTGIIICTILGVKNSKKFNIKEDDILDFIIFVIPFSIIGARLYYVFFQWDYYRGDIYKIINLRNGGLAIHGGLIFGLIGSYFFTKIKKINFLNFMDLICTFIPLAQSIGRWGNYTNGEAHGSVTTVPWAINVKGEMVHPTFLYESIWDFILFLFLFYLIKKEKNSFKGEIFSLYMVIYSIGRFFIEGMRTDSLMFFGLRIAQIVSLLLVIVGIIIFIYFKKKGKNVQS